MLVLSLDLGCENQLYQTLLFLLYYLFGPWGSPQIEIPKTTNPDPLGSQFISQIVHRQSQIERNHFLQSTPIQNTPFDTVLHLWAIRMTHSQNQANYTPTTYRISSSNQNAPHTGSNRGKPFGISFPNTKITQFGCCCLIW
jgi:hypothetical protein